MRDNAHEEERCWQVERRQECVPRRSTELNQSSVGDAGRGGAGLSYCAKLPFTINKLNVSESRV
jgi:hypothetical protein